MILPRLFKNILMRGRVLFKIFSRGVRGVFKKPLPSGCGNCEQFPAFSRGVTPRFKLF
jgi:hypothetical protein